MSSSARGGKRLKLNNLDGQLRGDWRLFNALVDLMRKEAWGLLVVSRRPRPLGSSSWRCSLPSYSDFSYQSALWAHRTSFFLPSSLAPRSFWNCWTKITHLNMPEKHGHPSPAIISWLYAWSGGAILWEAADRLFEVLLLPWMQSSELCLICEATCHLAYALLKYADYLDSSTEAMPGGIYTIKYWIVNNTECDADLRMYSVVTIIQCCGLYLHTLSVYT